MPGPPVKRHVLNDTPIPVNQGSHKVKVDGEFEDWDQIGTEYRDTRGDVFHRDHPGYGDLHYTDESGRNDILTAKVSVGKKNLAFYAQTDQALSSHQDQNWMLLLIDADKNPETGWYGYDFLVNRQIKDQNSTTLSAYDQETGTWKETLTLPFAYQENHLELSIPRRALGLQASDFEFDFKWSDNPAGLDDPISFCTGGDSAPNRRFNYRYIWKK